MALAGSRRSVAAWREAFTALDAVHVAGTRPLVGQKRTARSAEGSADPLCGSLARILVRIPCVDPLCAQLNVKPTLHEALREYVLVRTQRGEYE